MKSFLKRLILPQGEAPQVIRGGLLKGLRMQIDFAHHTQRWLGLQEKELQRSFRRLSEGIHSAIDVGASDGMYTVYFLARTSARKVLAFEPSSEGLLRLTRNLMLNRLEHDNRLEVITKFVGASFGGEWTTLDSFLQSIARPCLVKIDIDGGELELLRGAQTLLRLPGVRWIIEVHSKELEERCLHVLQTAEYYTRIVPNAWWRLFLPELRPVALNHWLVATQTNDHRM